MKKINFFINKNLVEIIIFLGFSFFSFWLMFSTFSYSNGNMLIASKAWSDFASHIPLIRSFSFGNNFPPQYPLFPGEPIRYHFLFYLIVGLMERAGVRIDIALNILSSLSFFFLLTMIYLLSIRLFKRKAVGIIAVILFLFNGSLSFLAFFKNFPLSQRTILDILTLNHFTSFGPYDGSIVSAFWNLNIYTNQRHLALSFSLVLLTIYLMLGKIKNFKKIFLLAITFIFLYYLNEAAFFINLLFLYFLIISKSKKAIFLLLPALLPIVFLIPYKLIEFKLGFLTPDPVTFLSFINYWLYNLGLYVFLIPISFFLIPKIHRIFILPLFVLFIVPNILKLSPDIVNNHKLINFFMLICSIFVANLLFFLWSKKLKEKIIVIFFSFFLILSGIIDLMPIINDYKITLPDYRKDEKIAFFKKINPKAVILNSTSLYHPASLAGRNIYFGYSYFAWSYGYDIRTREKIYSAIYKSTSKEKACKLLKENNISYVELNKNADSSLTANGDFWGTFNKVYSDKKDNLTAYDVNLSCDLK